MLTDWTLTDPRYFYARGALWGFVFATLLWLVLAPWLRRKLPRIFLIITLLLAGCAPPLDQAPPVPAGTTGETWVITRVDGEQAIIEGKTCWVLMQAPAMYLRCSPAGSANFTHYIQVIEAEKR